MMADFDLMELAPEQGSSSFEIANVRSHNSTTGDILNRLSSILAYDTFPP